jgi:hypothetical protein
MAEQATYSQDVANKTIHEIIKATNNSPILKVILPFVKTVWNVEVDLMEHTPLAFLSKQFREDIKAGGARARQAKGRMATGTVGIALMYWLCESGMITGELSDNPKEREAQQRAGIKPYSIRVGDTYISYDRLDPFGTLLGMTANFHQIHTKSEDMTEAKQKELGGAIAASLFKATMDKSFLSSLQEFVDMVSDVKNIDTKGSRFLAKQLQGFLPASGAARWLANKTDNIGGGRTERPEGFLEYVKDTPHIRAFNNIAYEAARLPTKYDWFTGKALSGYDYVYTKGKDDWVLDELSYISATTTGKPQRKLGRKVELTNEQYSELCRLHGTVKLRGKTLYEATKELMKSTKYDFDEKRHNHALIGENRSYKGDIVNKLIDEYRQAAIKELVKKYPQLAVDLKKAKATEKITKRGAGRGRQNTNRSPLSVLQK